MQLHLQLPLPLQLLHSAELLLLLLSACYPRLNRCPWLCWSALLAVSPCCCAGCAFLLLLLLKLLLFLFLLLSLV